MISKRNFISIVIVMVVLLFLFQFSMIFRDWKNTYDVNSNYVEKKMDGQNAWKQQNVNLAADEIQHRNYLVFVGNSGSGMERSVKQWCTYEKWNMTTIDSLEDIKSDLKTPPKMLVLESEKYALGNNRSKLEVLTRRGVIIVFGCVEDSKNLRNDPGLMEYLGISQIVSDKTTLEGVQLFEGLLLGGDALYDAEQLDDEEEKKRQDLNLEVPWYQVGSGTKTYMVGVFDKNKKMKGKKIKNEDLPTLIWRNGILGGNVFAVVGDYMKDTTALGILSGMLSEASDYAIYPVVNAQNLSMVNFPVFADENHKQMMKIYSQPIMTMARDVIWPSLISTIEKSGMKMTCFVSSQSDYTDGIEPEKGNLKFYLKQMKEQNAEAGLSMAYRKINSLADKQEQDQRFFKEENSSYKYGAAFVKHKDLLSALNLTETGLMKNIGTIICEPTEEEPVVSYCTDSVTLQSVVSDGEDYTYSDDIKMRSIQSALGYTNVMMDFNKIFWADKIKDQWQNVQKKFSGNLLTYWKNFRGFDSTTLSKSNQRTRTFLNLDYYHFKQDNKITLNTTHQGSCFLLRTNGRDIKNMKGGKYKKIEEGIYLIYAKENTIEIELKHQRLHYYSKTD